jgi:hypothetical protein
MAWAGHQTFLQAFGGDAETDVAIFGSGVFETRRVMFNASANRIEHTGPILCSSNGNSKDGYRAVDFGAGEKQIIVCVPGELYTRIFFQTPGPGAAPHVFAAVQAALSNQAI